MQTRSQSVKEHLEALHDELKSAAEKQDEQAKTKIRAAMEHANAAKAELHARLTADHVKDKAEVEETIGKLEAVAANGKKALDAKGTELQSHIKQMIATTKSALEH